MERREVILEQESLADNRGGLEIEYDRDKVREKKKEKRDTVSYQDGGEPSIYD